MSKYDQLGEYLARQTAEAASLTFSEVETIIGESLPTSARRHRAWWSNGGHVQSDSWMDCGWRVLDVDLAGQSVYFGRERDSEELEPRAAADVDVDPANPETETTESVEITDTGKARNKRDRKRLKRIERQMPDLRQSQRVLAEDVGAVKQLANRVVETKSEVLDRLSAVAAPPPVQDGPSLAVPDGDAASPVGDGATGIVVGTPFGFWATAGLALLAILGASLGGDVFVVALFGADIPARGLELGEIVAGIIALVAIVGVCSLRKGLSTLEYLALVGNPGIKTVFWWTLAAFIVDEVIFRLIPMIDPGYDPTWWWSEYTEIAADALLLFAFSTIVVAPLMEEALFRGFLFAGWSRSALGVAGTIMVTSALWAVLHVQYGIHEFAALFSFGIVLGYARYRTKSLWVPILMHGFFNLLANLAILTTE